MSEPLATNPEGLTEAGFIDRLDQRCRWLTARIAAKQSVGWDVTYDTSERDALAWALPQLRRLLADAQ